MLLAADEEEREGGATGRADRQRGRAASAAGHWGSSAGAGSSRACGACTTKGRCLTRVGTFPIFTSEIRLIFTSEIRLMFTSEIRLMFTSEIRLIFTRKEHGAKHTNF